jgi:tRNA (guanine-N7-)-methyltransferase
MTDPTRPIRTFHPRRGRMSARHTDAFAGMWATAGLTVTDGDRTALDLDELFGRGAPRVLEIGFGMGEATAAMAAADRGRDYLAVEVHTPGIGNLLALIRELGLTNVRVAHGDAMELVRRLAPASLDAVHVFFPDPWPKARHHKRRLIQPGNVRLLREVVRPGGVVHCATDWPHYAAAMAETLAADPGLTRDDSAADDNARDNGAPNDSARNDNTRNDNTRNDSARKDNTSNDSARDDGGRRHRGPARPVTKFERRGTEAGRPIVDLVYRRTDDA